MADVIFAAGFAIGLQVDAATLNATISGLAGALDETDGIVLGVHDAGTGETGITLPNFVREARELADVPSSFTRTANSLIKVNAESLDIAFLLKGNGVTSTPSADQAKPFLGIDALFEAGGLNGSTGTNPEYEYYPDPTTS